MNKYELLEKKKKKEVALGFALIADEAEVVFCLF